MNKHCREERRWSGNGFPTAVALCVLATLVPPAAVAISTTGEQLDMALRLKPRLDRGAEIFAMCAACHGQDGQGASDGSVPAIAGQSAPVLVKQIIEFRDDTRFNIRAQSFVAHYPLAPQELADVAAFVSNLPARQPAPARESPRAGDGATLFANLCASCHGPRAEGNVRARVPRLAGQHPEYLSRQLHDAAEGRRPSMSESHAPLLKELSSDDMNAIATYLAGVTPSAQPTRSIRGGDAGRPQ